MPLTNAQLVARACTIAKTPGYTVQAGQYLNMTLQTLCQTYDFDYIKKQQIITLNGNQGYALNSDHLRTKEVFYSVGGVIFYIFQIPIETFNALVEAPGVSNYPDRFAVDVSQSSTYAPQSTLLFYPPPNLSQTVKVNYFPQMPDISAPETDTTVCWFTNQEYLLTKIASMLMLETDDDRQSSFASAAEKQLSNILTMKDDTEGFSQTIKLSRERFRKGNGSNPNKAFPFGN